MAKAKKENSDSNELSLKNEILAILSLFSSFFLIFSLVSFTPLDPSFFRLARSRVVYNFGGRVGAELSALLFNLFGMASLLFIFAALFLTAYFIFNRGIRNAASKGIGAWGIFQAKDGKYIYVAADQNMDGRVMKAIGV